MPVDFQKKDSYDFDDLVAIMKILRGENGCPWDKEQNHRSIRKNLIEETYEAVEAIDKEDRELLKEELGDVLLQVVFHSEIERQSGGFDIHDVADGVCRKLIERHPHIFGDVYAPTSKEVLRNWDEIKKKEKNQKNQSEALESVPRVLPALMRSSKVQQRASKSGFDWPDAGGALEKTREELSELEAAVKAGDKKASLEELGDLLFSVVNISRFLKADPEEALTFSCDKFIRRFKEAEKMAAEHGRLEALSPEELDGLWNKAKKIL